MGKRHGDEAGQEEVAGPEEGAGQEEAAGQQEEVTLRLGEVVERLRVQDVGRDAPRAPAANPRAATATTAPTSDSRSVKSGRRAPMVKRST